MESIFNFKLSTIKPNLFKKDFIGFCDYDYGFYTSVATFHLQDDNFSFDYNYCIEASWCDNKIVYTLYLVPMAYAIDSNKMKSILTCSGLDDISEVTAYDICSYGCCIPLGTYTDDCEEIKDEIFNRIANVYRLIESTLGFYLDKTYNKFGTTGWDLLNDFLKGQDFVKKIFDKFAY